jgi:hypothetical protein
MIVENIVFGRDIFDRFIDGWRCIDIRLAWPAWIFWGILWTLRKLLIGLHMAIFYFNRARSRQAEFNADLVAVSAAGSDAPVHLLYKSAFGDHCLRQALTDLQVAMDHHLYTADLFYHQNHAASYLRRLRKDPHLGEPPPLPEEEDCSPDVFEPGDLGVPPMWASHPSNYDREQNAKDEYIHCPLDDRSPWILFDDPQAVRELVTWRFYRGVLRLRRDVELDDPARVQAFIDDEHAETTFDERYHGLYDARPIEPGDLEELVRTAKESPWQPDTVAGVYRRLYGKALQEHMKEFALLRDEYDLLVRLKRGEDTPQGTFKFRGRRYDVDEAKRLLKKVERELDEEQEWLAGRDRKVFLAHYHMALELGPKVAQELLSRYEFHLAVQRIDRDLTVQRRPLEAALAFLSGKSQLHYQEFNEIRTIFRQAHEALDRSLQAADRLELPALKNITKGECLGTFLLDRELVKALRPTAQTLTAKWINKFLGQMGEVQDRVRRIHFKSLGGLLALQEKVARKWLSELARAPEVVAAPEEPKEPREERPEVNVEGLVPLEPSARRGGRLRHQTL